MSNAELLQPYARTRATSAPKGGLCKLTPMMLMGVLAKIDQARQAESEGNPVAKGFFLGRATAIIDALRDELDFERGGSVTEDYEKLYSHIDFCLQEAVSSGSEGALMAAEETILQASSWWQATSLDHLQPGGHA